MFPSDQRNVEGNIETEEVLLKKVEKANRYRKLVSYPEWSQYVSDIRDRIEILDGQLTAVNDDQFPKWRAMRQEIRVLQNFLRHPATAIQAGDEAADVLKLRKERKEKSNARR